MNENEATGAFACTLPPPELQRRRSEVLAAVRRSVKRIDETDSGFVFTFDQHEGLREELEEFVRFEAACCSFIDMELTKHANTIELSMVAATGAKTFIEAEFINVSTGESSCGCGTATGTP